MIGKRFGILLALVLVAIVGGAYHMENEYINDSIAVAGRIERLAVVPKQRVVSVRIEPDTKQAAGRAYEIGIAFWDSRTVGEPIQIRRRVTGFRGKG